VVGADRDRVPEPEGAAGAPHLPAAVDLVGGEEVEEPGAALALFLERSHTAAPLQVPLLVDEAARRLGMTSATVYLADVQEDQLVPLPRPGEDDGGEALAIDGTVAGWAYRTMSLRLSHRRPLSVWLPLVDGIARIGVLQVVADQITPAMLDGATQLAAVTALTVVSKSGFSDLFSRASRRRPMTTAAEMVWAFCRRSRWAPTRSPPPPHWSPLTKSAATPSTTAWTTDDCT
jgi:hypothetical protein